MKNTTGSTGLWISVTGMVVLVLSNGVETESTRIVVVTIAFVLFVAGGWIWIRARRRSEG